MAEIIYIKGNAVYPKQGGKKIIAHVCNDIGGWGVGFVLAISKRWPLPEREYRAIPTNKRKLGNVQFVVVEDDIIIANMIGQEDIKPNVFDVPPVRYEAIKVCFERVVAFADATKATIHIPRIGCGLAGGEWSIMEPVLKAASKKSNVNIFVYDLE